MISRTAQIYAQRLALGFPVLALTGPRQAGKTTLARAVFADKPYVSLENPDAREFAQQDPRRFLAQFGAGGAIVDEIQREPQLLSWLQGWVDEHRRMGQFVITGSAQFDLLAGISQSLAGRVGRIELLPLSLSELAVEEAKTRAFDTTAHSTTFADLDTLMFQGGYPALYDTQRQLDASDWFGNYLTTYVERDVRNLVQVRDLSQFQRFVRLCAARSGQVLNAAALGADAGVSAQTTRQWLSVLETSYLVKLLPPYFNNFGKRLTKAPKLYFLDTGLLCYLLGISHVKALSTHAARGAVFETWAVSELIKARYHQGRAADLYFWRQSDGKEVDVLRETPQGLELIELKSGATVASDWFASLKSFPAAAHSKTLIYGGDASYEREGVQVQGWRSLGQTFFN